jgi:hypothetical protein
MAPLEQGVKDFSAAAQVPLPGCEALAAAAAGYRATERSGDYFADLVRAHRAAGLLQEHASADGHR